MRENNTEMISPSFEDIRLALFASGSGSNVEAILDFAKVKGYLSQIKVLICDKPQAQVIERAKKFHIPALFIEYKKNLARTKEENKKRHEELIRATLDEYGVNWIALAGYMRIFSEDFISHYPNRIINIHPSLLPKYKGKDAYEQAFASGDHKSGITIHFVDSGIDTGPIIYQKSFKRLDNDNLETFKSRGLKLEHTIYPMVLEQLFKNKQLCIGQIYE